MMWPSSSEKKVARPDSSMRRPISLVSLASSSSGEPAGSDSLSPVSISAPAMIGMATHKR